MTFSMLLALMLGVSATLIAVPVADYAVLTNGANHVAAPEFASIRDLLMRVVSLPFDRVETCFSMYLFEMTMP